MLLLFHTFFAYYACQASNSREEKPASVLIIDPSTTNKLIYGLLGSEVLLCHFVNFYFCNL